jgi:Reverse transcriptase (RNA-dependent DNA polymerase)
MGQVGETLIPSELRRLFNWNLSGCGGELMYDSTIHMRTLARHVSKSDFHSDKSLYDQETLRAEINRAVEIGLSGFSSISLRTNMLKGKNIYQVSDLAESLVVRHITSNIRRVTRVKQDDRQFIVRCLKNILSEGIPLRLYKLDISSFYESVPLELVFQNLESDYAFSGQSIRALRSLFEQLKIAGVSGLPRGVSLSATLSEYLLREFDKKMSERVGVWFFARFVDDIVVVSDGREDQASFMDFAREILPNGLRFNSKSAILDFKPFVKGNGPSEEHGFDYLGYHFSVGLSHQDRRHDGKRWRDTWLDIAPSKVRKIKSRIAKALIAYSGDSDFLLLLNRIRLLTSNFNFVDKKTGARRISGIFFNYPLIDAARSKALQDLDLYLLHAITSRHPKNRLYPVMTTSQRQQLLNLRFQDGFRNKRFFSFSPMRLAALTSCWAYA